MVFHTKQEIIIKVNQTQGKAAKEDSRRNGLQNNQKLWRTLVRNQKQSQRNNQMKVQGMNVKNRKGMFTSEFG